MAQDWLLVFCDPEPLGADAKFRDKVLYWFLNRFLKPGFRHVFALRPAEGFEGWIVVNPHATCIDLLEVTGHAYRDLLSQRRREGYCEILAVRARRPETWPLRITLSCVSVVSHLLGIDCGVFTTPWRLYRKLVGRPEGMGGLFKGPRVPDTAAPSSSSSQEAALKAAERERDVAKAQSDARIRNLKNRKRGRALLTFTETGELGVRDKTTLGP